MRKIICVAVLLFLAAPVTAEELGWSGKGELGLVVTSGNSDTQALNIGVEFVRESEKWRHEVTADYLNAENNNLETANRYGIEWQTDYKLSEVSYVFGSLRYDKDDFSAFSESTSAVLGYGRKFINNERHRLKGEAGLGVRSDKDAVTRESNSEAVLRGSLDYEWKISESAAFGNKFLVESGSDNTFIENDAALNVAINDKFALKFGIVVRHNTDVTGTLDDTDTLTTANLVYNFK